jgi:hypothetical protein
VSYTFGRLGRSGRLQKRLPVAGNVIVQEVFLTFRVHHLSLFSFNCINTTVELTIAVSPQFMLFYFFVLRSFEHRTSSMGTRYRSYNSDCWTGV